MDENLSISSKRSNEPSKLQELSNIRTREHRIITKYDSLWLIEFPPQCKKQIPFKKYQL